MGRLTERGGGATAAEVATSFPGHCFGAIKGREGVLKHLERRKDERDGSNL